MPPRTEAVSNNTDGVFIPLPFALPQREGINSLIYNGRSVQTRMNYGDVPFIDQEAAALGVSRAHFMRWAALHLAMECYRRRTGKTKEVVL